MTPEIMAFFAGRPEEEALWQTLHERCMQVLEAYEVKTGKTQLSLCSGCMFACVSHPRSKKQTGIIVTFGLPCRAESPRIWQASEPYPGRWTHHVIVSRPEEIDEELKNWLMAAQSFVIQKKR